MCMARWRKGSWFPWKILIPILISSKAQWKIFFQLCWTTSMERSCAFLFAWLQFVSKWWHNIVWYWEAEEISFSLQGKSKYLWQKIHEIELNTWEQRINLVVSSKTLLYQFIFIQASPPAQGTDPPDSLVLQILQAKQFSTPATQWGISNEL